MKKILLSSACIAVLAACNSSDQMPETNKGADVAKSAVETAVQSPAKPALTSGIALENIDPSVRVQDDLYRHVSGKWLNEFEIPADKSNYGSFTKLAEKAREDVKLIIEESAQVEAKKGSDTQKVGDLFKSYMNETLLEEIGTKPLIPEMAKIDAINNASDLSHYIGHAQVISRAPFSTYVYADARDPDTTIAHIGQSGLGLPGRDYYFKDDPKSQEIRDKYVVHIGNMLELAGIPDAKAKAKAVFNLETQIAEAHWTKEKNRNPIARYNKKAFADLAKEVPELDWKRWQKSAMYGDIGDILVAQPDYIVALGKMMNSVNLDDWKSYFKWHLISRASGYMNKAVAEESFRFYRTELRGVEQQEPRWKRGVSVINSTLGEVVGKIYVERHFNSEAKKRMSVLVENLRKGFAESINGLEWMGAETKVQALDKLAKFTPKIGYPDKWKDYSALAIKADDLIGNMQRAALVETKRNRDQLGKPVDRSEWFMTPQTVNAYYNPVMNEIVFPAAILQPPFFNLEADDAVNYGGIGAVIGHEMGHGFDDSGSKYDGNGKLRDWWTKADRDEFEKRAGKLIKQYDGFTVLDDVHVNGTFTQGENIGDLGGLSVAYKAYKLSLNGEKSSVIDGYTGEQRVFMGWAQVWARKYRDEELRNRIQTDSHSPSEFRANGIVMNLPAFYEAFDVKEGDKLFLKEEDRVKIW
jgi:putative endopeptidase